MLSFVPLELLHLAFYLVIAKKPELNQNDKIDLFIKYYQPTWLYDSFLFPPKIWNHFGTVGPRTNNHVEAFNFKLNTYSFWNRPDIFV